MGIRQSKQIIPFNDDESKCYDSNVTSTCR